MGRVLARDCDQATTRPRRASAASVELACGYCLKSFSRKSDLKRHEMLHLGVKNHQCHKCGGRFAQKSALKIHMYTHTGEKIYPCKYEGCGKIFGDPSCRRRHERDTCGNYIFKCPAKECTSRIARRPNFVTHLKDKHGIVPTSTELAGMKELKVSKLAPSQCRKASHVDRSRSRSLARAESTDSAHLNRRVAPPHLSTAATREQISPARDVLHHQSPRGTQSYFLPDQSHQIDVDVQSLFSAPILSSSTTLSTFSAQSSTETLVEGFKYEDYKMFCVDVADYAQSLNPALYLTPSSSPSPRTPKAPPFAKNVYQLSPSSMHPWPLDHLWINPQIAYDRQRYVPNMGESPTPYLFGHKSYTVPQAQEKDIGYSYPQLDLAQQAPPQSWQLWFS